MQGFTPLAVCAAVAQKAVAAISQALLAATVAFLVLVTPTIADEGMWRPQQLLELRATLKAEGLKLPAEAISKLTDFPMSAVISLGGCTASFVSPKGLIVTNHHCAYSSIQHNSTVDNNLLESGFLAETFGRELPAAPGSRVYVTESLDRVTEQITANLAANLSPLERYRAIQTEEKALVSKCEKSAGYRCEIYSFHGGLEYYLIKQLAIRDVRLVYAPASSIGRFGGDTDNWMWPRHTGDWSFYRAYVDGDGKPSDYSADNVPFAPKSHLSVSAKGVADEDFVMVAGYPGRTNRYRIADEVAAMFAWSYPTAKRYREEMIRVIETAAPAGSEARIKYQSTLASLANYAKNYGSMIESYKRGDMLHKKRRLEIALRQWIDADPSRCQRCSSTIDTLQSLIARQQQHRQRDLLMAYMGRNSMLSSARRLLRLAHERRLPDSQREPGYQTRDMARFRDAMTRVSGRYHGSVDAEVLIHFMPEYVGLDPAERIVPFDGFFAIAEDFDADRVATQIRAMHATTQLADEQVRLAWMERPFGDFERSEDPFIQLALALFEHDLAKETKQNTLTGALQQARPAYMQALIAFYQSLGKTIYADANGSLRVSFGTVRGYAPKDGLLATPFTTLAGIAAKHIDGDHEFDVPSGLLAAIATGEFGGFDPQGFGSVPVNFLATLDSTGGNSGSPVMNDQAQLVGLLFDGVYESIIGDWDYDPGLNRSIQVDARYMLWVMKYVDGADNLLDEMDLVR